MKYISYLWKENHLHHRNIIIIKIIITQVNRHERFSFWSAHLTRLAFLNMLVQVKLYKFLPSQV